MTVIAEEHRMKRTLASALMISVFALVGCGDTTKTEDKTTTQTPGGTTTETKTDKVNQSGSNPPAPAETPK